MVVHAEVSNGIAGPSGRARRAKGAVETILEGPTQKKGAELNGNRHPHVPTQVTRGCRRGWARDVLVPSEVFEVGEPLLNEYHERCWLPFTVKN